MDTSRRRTAVFVAITLLMSALVAVRTDSAANAADRTHGSLIEVVKRDLGLSGEAFQRRVAQEQAAIQLRDDLIPGLGDAYGGSWFDAQTGGLAVAVTTEAAALEVSNAGAHPVRVQRPLSQLEGSQARLEQSLGQDGFTAVGVDAQTNSVVVTILDGHEDKEFGPGARTEFISSPPETGRPYLDGGEAVTTHNLFEDDQSCSAGFNMRDERGAWWLLGAGHCTGPVPSLTLIDGFDDSFLGSTVGGYFPGMDYDLALVAGEWTPGPWVSAYQPNDAVFEVYEALETLEHGLVCKSGRTTGTTCGVVRRRSESILVRDRGRTVMLHGMTRITACTEPGDSGGSVYAPVSTGNLVNAQGVHSSGSLLPNGRCREAWGLENISWIQPIFPVLRRHPDIHLVTIRNY